MDRTDPQHAVVALAAFLRRRLSEVGGWVPSGWVPSGIVSGELISSGLARFRRRGQTGPAEIAAAEDAALAAAQSVVAASAPFAATSYARARLLRQLHASGLLTENEAQQAADLLQIAQ